MTASARPTNAQKLVALLKDRRYHSSRELLNAGGFRYGARLNELRKLGYVFTWKRDAKRRNLFWYRMTGKPSVA